MMWEGCIPMIHKSSLTCYRWANQTTKSIAKSFKALHKYQIACSSQVSPIADDVSRVNTMPKSQKSKKEEIGQLQFKKKYDNSYGSLCINNLISDNFYFKLARDDFWRAILCYYRKHD